MAKPFPMGAFSLLTTNVAMSGTAQAGEPPHNVRTQRADDVRCRAMNKFSQFVALGIALAGISTTCASAHTPDPDPSVVTVTSTLAATPMPSACYTSDACVDGDRR